MQFGSIALQEAFEVAGIVLALLAIVTGIVRLSGLFSDLKIQIASVQTDIRGIRYRVDRIEEHLAPPAGS